MRGRKKGETATAEPWSVQMSGKKSGGKQTQLAGKWTMNEDVLPVFPIEHGDFRHVGLPIQIVFFGSTDRTGCMNHCNVGLNQP